MGAPRLVVASCDVNANIFADVIISHMSPVKPWLRRMTGMDVRARAALHFMEIITDLSPDTTPRAASS